MMEQLSFSEKLKVLVDVSSSSGICIASIVLLLFMAFLFLTTNKKNAKSSKKFYLIIYTILIGSLFIIYSSSISDMFDYMMNNFFIIVYFPNLAVYLAAIVATNIILWVTIFNYKEDRLLKVINTMVYCMIHYLLILILNTVVQNKLDVFDQTSVYANSNAFALIGLTSTIFLVWVIFLVLYKIIRSNQKKKQGVPVHVRRVIRYKRKLPESISIISTPNVVQGRVSKDENKEVDLVHFYKQQNSMLEEQYQAVLREKEEQKIRYQKQQEEQEQLKKYQEMFTLEDYKKVLSLLQKESTPVIVQEEVIKSSSTPEFVIDEEISTSQEEVEQPKLEELLNLYRSI